MLKIDIEALADCVDRLCWINLRTARQAEFAAVLERLRGNIDDSRWQRKISYFHALNALGLNWDRDAGKTEFQKLGAITADENDLELLQLYIDLHGDELSFSILVGLFDRILELSDAVSDHLQYRGAKAVQYFLIGDSAHAERELDGAIELCREKETAIALSSYGRLKLSNCLELLSIIRPDRGLLDQAINILTSLIEEGGLTDEGRVNLYKQLGDCYRHAGAWSDAENAYRSALAIKAAPICEVFLSESLLNLGKHKEATTLISRVNVNDLDPDELADYVFALSAISVETADKIRLEEAKDLLEKLKVSAPYFNERRLELLVNVSNTIKSGPSDSIATSTRAMLAGMVRFANKHIILQPNFMGIGINLNSVIGDLAKDAHAEVEMEDDEEAGPPPLSRSTVIVRKTEDQIWRTSGINRRRSSRNCDRLRFLSGKGWRGSMRSGKFA